MRIITGLLRLLSYGGTMRHVTSALIGSCLLLVTALNSAPPQAAPAGGKKETPKAKPAPKPFPPYLDCIPPWTKVLRGKLSVPAAPKDFKVERNYKPVA